MDELEAEDLVAFVREDERPLRGLAGLLDWRLCGFLTRNVRNGVFRGAKGEPLLTVSHGRVGPSRLFLFGLGDAEGEAAEAQIGAALQAVARAGGKDLALAPPLEDKRATAVVARGVARLAHEAGIRRLALLSEDPRAMDKALAVVESTFAWAHLED